MAMQKQDDQHEHTFSNYVSIRDVVQKTCLKRWTIGKSGERGSGISMLPARHDDNDDIYILNAMCMFIYLFIVYFSFAPVISAITHRYCELFYIQVLMMVIITETLTSTSHHDIFTYLDYIFSCYLHIYIYIYIYIYMLYTQSSIIRLYSHDHHMISELQWTNETHIYKIYISHFILERGTQFVVGLRDIWSDILREVTSSCPISSSWSQLVLKLAPPCKPYRQRRPNVSDRLRIPGSPLSRLCLNLTAWLSCGLLPVTHLLDLTALTRCHPPVLLNTTWQLVKAHRVTRSEPMSYVI